MNVAATATMLQVHTSSPRGYGYEEGNDIVMVGGYTYSYSTIILFMVWCMHGTLTFFIKKIKRINQILVNK